MSQSTLTSNGPWTGLSDGPMIIDGADDIQAFLTVLDDANCRAVLEATSDDPLSANELSESCDIPLSTVYRKLDLLTEAGLLREGTRIRRSGKHTSEYSRRLDEVTVSVDVEEGFALEVTHRSTTGRYAGALATGL